MTTVDLGVDYITLQDARAGEHYVDGTDSEIFLARSDAAEPFVALSWESSFDPGASLCAISAAVTSVDATLRESTVALVSNILSVPNPPSTHAHGLVTDDDDDDDDDDDAQPTEKVALPRISVSLGTLRVLLPSSFQSSLVVVAGSVKAETAAGAAVSSYVVDARGIQFASSSSTNVGSGIVLNPMCDMIDIHADVSARAGQTVKIAMCIDVFT